MFHVLFKINVDYFLSSINHYRFIPEVYRIYLISMYIYFIFYQFDFDILKQHGSTTLRFVLRATQSVHTPTETCKRNKKLNT